MSKKAKLKHVPSHILRRIHYGMLSGTSMAVLAKANYVDIKSLKELLPQWRELNGMDKPVSSTEFIKAIHKVDTSAIDYCWIRNHRIKQANMAKQKKMDTE